MHLLKANDHSLDINRHCPALKAVKVLIRRVSFYIGLSQHAYLQQLPRMQSNG